MKRRKLIRSPIISELSYSSFQTIFPGQKSTIDETFLIETHHEGGIRIPALLSWPAKIREGRVIDQPAINADLVPTLTHLTGFEQALRGRTIDGQNITQLLMKDTSYHREIYWYFNQRGDFAYRSGNWKIIGNELYNLAEDISESNDLAVKMPEKYAELKQAYDSVAKRMRKYQFTEMADVQ